MFHFLADGTLIDLDKRVDAEGSKQAKDNEDTIDDNNKHRVTNMDRNNGKASDKIGDIIEGFYQFPNIGPLVVQWKSANIWKDRLEAEYKFLMGVLKQIESASQSQRTLTKNMNEQKEHYRKSEPQLKPGVKKSIMDIANSSMNSVNTNSKFISDRLTLYGESLTMCHAIKNNAEMVANVITSLENSIKESEGRILSFRKQISSYRRQISAVPAMEPILQPRIMVTDMQVLQEQVMLDQTKEQYNAVKAYKPEIEEMRRMYQSILVEVLPYINGRIAEMQATAAELKSVIDTPF